MPSSGSCRICLHWPTNTALSLTHTHTHTHTHTCTHVCYIEPLGSDGSKIDSDSQSFWFWFTHTHTHTHTHTQTHTHSMALHSYVLPAERLWSLGWWVCCLFVWGFLFFFSLSLSNGTLQHTELVTRTTWSGQSRGTQREQTGQNLGHADSQVVEQFLPIRQYSRSLHDFHGTFYTGFHLSTSGKCVTGGKTLGFFVNHVNIVLLRCPPLQAIATISPWLGE